MDLIAIRELFFILRPEFHPDHRMHFKWRLRGRLESLTQPEPQGRGYIQIHNANTLISHVNFSHFMFCETFRSLFVTIWLNIINYLFILSIEKLNKKDSFLKNRIWWLTVDMNHIWLLLCASQSSSCLCCSLCTKGDGPEQRSRGENPCVGISLC